MRNLVKGVRGHNRLGKILRGRLAEVGGEGGGGLLPKIHLELRADDARGRGQDIRRFKPKGAGHQFLGCAAVPHAFIAGAGVGLPGIDPLHNQIKPEPPSRRNSRELQKNSLAP